MPIEQLGYKVSLWSDGEEIPVYKVESEDATTITCYIPSTEGKFHVEFVNKPTTGYAAAVHVFVDGRKMQGIIVHQGESNTVKGVYDTLSDVRPFQFVKLKVKEDDDNLHGSSVDLANLGMVEVRVHRIMLVDSNEPSGRQFRPRCVQAELDAVSEKSKKVGWHSVSLGTARHMSHPADIPNTTYVDAKHAAPYAVFRFRYRPKDMLEDQGIIPRVERCSASPSRSSPAGPHASTGKRPRMSDDEDGRRNKRHKSMRAEPGPSTRVKKEAEVVDLTGRRAPSPIRVPEGTQGEVVDLTGD